MSAGSPPPALLAVGHGSRDPRAASTLTALVDAAAGLLPGVAVRLAWLDHSDPRVLAGLTALAAEGHHRVAVVPLLLTPAYHSEVDLPAGLAEARATMPALDIAYGRPLGPDPLLIAACERRLAEVGVDPGDPSTAVALVAAGSSDPDAIASVRAAAAAWRSRGWHDVGAAFASAAEPTPAGTIRRLRDAGAARVVMASYLLAPGFLPDRAATSALAAGADAVSAPLGAAPEVATLLARRYAEVADG